MTMCLRVTVSFEQSSYTVAEGSSETVKLKLSSNPERTVEVPISATDMDGASSSDYSIAPQTVVFNSGDTEKTFTFSATNDTENDDGERVRLNFGTLPPRVSSTSPSQAVVSITDDDDHRSPSALSKSPTQSRRAVAKRSRWSFESADHSHRAAQPPPITISVVFNSGDTAKTIDLKQPRTRGERRSLPTG